MRIVDLETFVTLAQIKHFGKTAEALRTTQPAVSARIAALEREFGAQLVRRGERQFELTEEGALALAGFRKMLAEMTALKRGIAGGERGAGLVRIGAIDAITSTWLPALVEALREKHPLLRIELTVDGTLGLVQRMKSGELDLVFGLDPVIDEGFRSFVSCVFEMVWVGASTLIDPDRDYTLDELSELPIIAFPQDTPPYRMVAPYFQDENILASQLTSSNSLFAMINLVIDGFGVATIPTVVVRRELTARLLHRIKVAKRFPAMPIVASYRPQPGSDLIDIVVAQARESAARFCAGVDPSMAWVE